MEKKSYVFTYKMENCLDVHCSRFGSVILSDPKKKQRQYQAVWPHIKDNMSQLLPEYIFDSNIELICQNTSEYSKDLKKYIFITNTFSWIQTVIFIVFLEVEAILIFLVHN